MRGLLPEFRRYLLAAALLLPAPGAFAVDCPLDTNPACASAIDLGTISGDSGYTTAAAGTPALACP